MRALVAVTASLAIIGGLGMGAFAARWYTLRKVGVGDGVHSGLRAQHPPPPTTSAPVLRRATSCCWARTRGAGCQAVSRRSSARTRIGGVDPRRTRSCCAPRSRHEQDRRPVVPARSLGEHPGHGTDKINSAFEGGIERGGPQLMAETIYRSRHIPVDHYLYVDLNGFQQAVDKLGGVDMCIPSYYVNTPGDLRPSTRPETMYIRLQRGGTRRGPVHGARRAPRLPPPRRHASAGLRARAAQPSRRPIPTSPVSVGNSSSCGR